MRRLLVSCLYAGVALIAAASCGPAGEQVAPPPGAPAIPSQDPNPISTLIRPTPTPRPSSTPGFGELSITTCDGQPSAEQVEAALRTKGVLPVGVEVTVTRGPLCSGTWQFTVVNVPGRDPLQVVTEGPANRLRVVTAGTNVCTPEVRALAPYGLRSVAVC